MQKESLCFWINEQKLVPDSFEFGHNTEIKILGKLKEYTVKIITVAGDLRENNIPQITTFKPRDFLFSDQQVFQQHLSHWNFLPTQRLLFESSEQNKNMGHVLLLIDHLAQNHSTKHDILYVVGGGVTQEVGGFAAACFKRGIKWTYLPTTLVSMADSCIGGKTNLNHGSIKNLLGLFSPPDEIILHESFLTTLSESDWYSGQGEILKSFLIGGEHYLKIWNENISALSYPQKATPANTLQINSPYTRMLHLTLLALTIKKAVVEEDEFENNVRSALNYGHTLGHVLESISQFSLPHGTAIVLGMLAENRLAQKMGVMDSQVEKQVAKLLLPLIPKYAQHVLQQIMADENPRSSWLSLISQDKKSVGEKINFAFLKKPGSVTIKSLDLNDSLNTLINQILTEIAHGF